jgi:amino acid adenylation domain-containing protein
MNEMTSTVLPNDNLPGADEVFVLPASPAQAGLWFLLQLAPGSKAYSVPAALRLTGELSAGALERALRELLRRHESLRTTFDVVDGEISQIVHPEREWSLEQVDLRGLPAADREAECRARCAREADRSFDLRNGPLVRPTLFVLGEREHVLLLMMHHIITDGWSMGILAQELGALYQAAFTGREDSLAELPLQYADFAIWHREWLASGVLERQLAYWRAELSGSEGVLALPTDHARPRVLGDRGGRVQAALTGTLVTGLRQVASACGATLFMTLHAVFATLLHRYSRADELLVGVPAANRGHAATQGLIGFFSNTLVLRTSFEGDPSFVELLRRVREAATRAFDNQDAPFDEVVRAVQARRDMGRHPLFQVMCAMDNAPADAWLTPDLHVGRFEIPLRSAKFELTLFSEERASEVALTLEYSADLFEEASVAAMLAHFAELCRSVVADPHRRVSSLSLMTEAERLWLVHEWNRTEPSAAPAACALDLIEAQVARAPGRTAVVDGARRLSYAELDARASAMGAALVAAGVRAGDVVGLALPRSADLVAGLLAIWKCGAAYVPLDPTQPAPRLALIVHDAGVRVAVVDAARADVLPRHVRRVLVEDVGTNAGCARRDVRGDALAYVIFTSGSTGRPKGVMISHGGLVSYLTWAARAYAPDGRADAPVHSTIAFDLTVTSLLVPLVAGASVHLVPEDQPIQGLMDVLIREREIGLVKLTPAHLELLVQLLPAEAWSALRACLVVGGEALGTALVERVRALSPGCRIINEYGPTETVVGCCVHEVGSDDGAGASVPIGRPIANTRLYVLDDRMEPVPIGVPGELYIGGAGVGLGYVGDATRSAAAFVPDPFVTGAGDRLYRTGDLVRHRRDGRLEFIGRRDEQVKVRGHRIELGEIESVLGQHPGVHEAVVVAVADGQSDTRLAAYLVTTTADVEVAAVRAFVAERLPAYMVPAHLVRLDALPLTPNGKVDRRALSRLPVASAAAAPARAVLHTETERVLAALWATVLGVTNVGREDDFFALGGHSLRAAQLVARVREHAAVELPLRAIFESPRLAEQARLVDLALGAGNAGHARIAPVPPGPARQRLSSAQRRLWFLDQLEPGNPFYNVSAAVRLTGPLDTAALEAALAALVDRHEVLRTTFRAEDGEPLQVVHPSMPLALALVDLSEPGAPGAPVSPQAWARCQELARQEALTPFSLTSGPLLRATLVRLGAAEHVLLLTMHHIVSDGWSVAVLVRELATLYQARPHERATALPPLPIQYADHAHWQRSLMAAGSLQGSLAFWQRTLAAPLPALELPTDHPRPALPSFRGAHLATAVPARLHADLDALARAEGATLFMVLLAAFSTLLYRHSRQHDLVVGTPVANRNRVETEGLIGFFVNLLALRVDLSAQPSFRQLLARVRRTTLDAFAHQDVPFEALVEALHPERDPSRSPLFQAMLVLQNAPPAPLALPGLELELLEWEPGTARYDVTLLVEERNDALQVRLEYALDLFHPDTAQRMLGHFLRLLEAATLAPDTPIDALPTLSDEERHQLLVTWNDTRADVPVDTSFQRLFAQSAHRHLDTVAAVDDTQSLSYRQLEERANGLAQQLSGRGVGPDCLVALYAARSVDFLVAILGVLKAGAAYVPIEPAHPVRRVREVLAQARPVLVLHDHASASRLGEALAGMDPAPAAMRIEEIHVSPEAPPDRGDPRSLAYVIFTSGSTGRPKGAMVEHAGMINHLFAKVQALGLGRGDIIVQNASQCFDISVWQFLVCLLVGGRVRIVDDDTARDAVRLLALVRSEAISVLEIVPSLLQVVVQDPACRAIVRDLRDLRWLVLTGEALPPALARAWLRLRPDIPIVNAYGPTECSDDVTHHVLTEPPAEDMVHTPIGQTLPNLRLYVLDPAGELLPVGVPGELFVGGVGVGRGYLDEPAKTAQAFVPDPFGSAGSRLYRTGDRVRRLADGSLEFLGRLDHQVKIRGHRIELGEIESVLSRHPMVHETVVVGRRDRGGELQLVAYCAPRDLTVATLRQWLEDELPAYMVPAAFVLLDALPRNRNGKVDRQELPAPAEDDAWASAPYLAPRTETESQVAEVWAELLGVAQVGARDDFFALGGHSLLAMRAMSRMRDRLGVELPLRDLFEASSLERFAARVDARRRSAAAAHAIVPVARDGVLPLSFAQERLWFFEQLEPGSHVFNMPGAFRLTGAVDAVALAHALQALAQRHEVLRTTFGSRDGAAVLAVHPTLPLDLGRVDLNALPPEEREAALRELARTASMAPFDLSRGPLLRATLAWLGDDDHVLFVTLHHIVADGWSLGILMDEVLELYAAAAAGREAHLAPLPVQYVDYARWQRTWLEGERMRAALAYWMDALRGPLPLLELPADRPRPRVQRFTGAVVETVLPAAQGQALRELGRSEEATLFMTLLAGFEALLQRLTGLEDIIVGTPVSGRDRTEVERLIGCFINTLALRTRVTPAMSFRALVRAVRETCVAAFAHQELPFEKLVEALGVERSLSHTPVFQVLFNMLDLPAGATEPRHVDGLTIAPWGEGLAIGAKFDLTLYLDERTDGSLRLLLAYNTHLFEVGRMEELLVQLRALLAAGLAQPDASISAISLLSEAQRRTLPDPTAALAPRWHGSILERLTAWAERTPDQVAVKDASDTWTYGELAARSLALARALHARGVAGGEVVAIVGHRSASLLWAMLGALQAGAAFVILDPAHPAARLAAQLRVARPAALLVPEITGPVSEALAASAAEAGVRVTLTLPSGRASDLAALWPESATPLSLPGPGPEELAYLAFTSGSTGMPKAVAGTHLPLSHFLAWHADTHALGPAERVSMLSGLAHDPLLRDAFTALWVGGTACIPDPGQMAEPGYLLRWLAREHVSVAHLTPAMAELVFDRSDTIQLPALRHVLLGGAPLRRSVVEALRAHAPDAACVNVYGTTETPQVMSAWHLPPGAPLAEDTVPIGTGIEGVQVLVLTPAGALAGLGEPGEIHVRTPYLTRGYVDDDALTAARFVVNPFTGVAADRLYRTGDRGRYRADGSVDILGRLDGQVQIRGFRVEPDEIAAALEQHPAVARAIIAPFTDGRGELGLCAYVCYRDPQVAQPGPAELRVHLAGLLPAYMVPAAFATLADVPLTPNGKVDLKALPPPSSAVAAAAFVAPRTPTEEAVAEIWSEVLGTGPIGVEHGFFDVGGHSLAATQVVSRLRSRFQVELPLHTLFQAKTIAAIAAVIEEAILAEIHQMTEEEAELLAAAVPDEP